MTDPISDMLIVIKNAQAVKKEQVVIPFSRMKLAIAKVLKDSEFITDYEKKAKKIKNSEHDFLYITLKYEDNHGAISDIKLVSKPSRRMYLGAKEIRPVRSGYGIGILSTSKGVMSSIEARKSGLGGEIICEIW
ncbi:MAG: 30S ribosomal protein S8 [Candidatus Yanofskybacteria bacterium GW2011_GWF1_44_227]|uniref:Small ribosomal subunit protein uS8 n=1 Tax=Candidatus Yanofskybacteria bacterium GW2011_GWE2_40_11 TaxID=1619033 RepID=A0A0G0QIV8_9BACT|nr:MAG: 30S ribosomal protein S8 [Candidatus Yanofskybacteria bacterium GW2011_GWE1_40_10]KKR40073.1 MAG: 30S ribosomal protein S8 [Candidatus Yanofskybacteria bacterium GW2011_GWE2_40_11]KKT15060.1 MAG: 30S ribosomal protein S8 [Candidatus Yanofskybacteria bacterium GW2011_GWF2_43_596]KKT52863.1 MAG: 30S ribosomal protein S8 [Candidatus Yanofskybacteria bacterium GW2011_GWF1_44_227]OGN35655.1 MAG: 30S ribosomal protein S8 [Candidatus Yanofskybacteria bacterium RIFOXYA1_FULL_44_17]OGN36692.1 M